MADFNIIYPTLIKFEGYYANDPNDPGGETYQGVARKYNPFWAGWKIIDAYKAAHNGFIPTNTKINDPALDQLVKDRAKQYFDKIYGTQIKSNSIATIAIQVFWGTAEGIKQVVQQAAINLGAKISADNTFGPQTLAAINTLPQIDLYNEMKRLYINYFTRLGTYQPQYATGWLNRVKYVISITDKFIKSEGKNIGLLLIAVGVAYLILKK